MGETETVGKGEKKRRKRDQERMGKKGEGESSWRKVSYACSYKETNPIHEGVT